MNAAVIISPELIDQQSREKHILTFKLPMIQRLETVKAIVVRGYNATGCKFDVTFGGSKGYLSFISIGAEGTQDDRTNNRIWVERLRTKTGALRSIEVEVYHSHEHGVRISIPRE